MHLEGHLPAPLLAEIHAVLAGSTVYQTGVVAAAESITFSETAPPSHLASTPAPTSLPAGASFAASRVIRGNNFAPPAETRVPEFITAAQTPSPSPPAVPVLLLDTGARVPVTGLLLIGRAPTSAGGDPTAVLVTVPDPDSSVSRTHLAVGRDGRGLWVRDLGSTNRTIVVDDAGRQTMLQPETAVYLTPTDSVVFGDRGFTVEYHDAVRG